ncbi:MAG: glycosyltransferase [Chloroflexi bacterium]|nr:glycosyltransferase [Chloroflexota bacterium]
MLLAADRVVCATEGYSRLLSVNYPSIPAERFLVSPNGYDEDDCSGKTPQRDGCFRLTYVGTLLDFAVRPRPRGWGRLFEPIVAGGAPVLVRTPGTILEAAAQLIDSEPGLGNILRLRFIGAFPEKYRQLIRDRGLEHVVELYGYVDHGHAIQAMFDAEVLFLMQAGAGSANVIPGKIYEYMRSGTPILGLFPEGLAAKLIRTTRTGVVISPDDIPALREQILSWYSAWRRGERLTQPAWPVIHQYSRRGQAEKLAECMEALVKRQQAVRGCYPP